MLSLIYAWINDWVKNRETGDLRRNRAHYDVSVMYLEKNYRDVHCIWDDYIMAKWKYKLMAKLYNCVNRIFRKLCINVSYFIDMTIKDRRLLSTLLKMLNLNQSYLFSEHEIKDRVECHFLDYMSLSRLDISLSKYNMALNTVFYFLLKTYLTGITHQPGAVLYEVLPYTTQLINIVTIVQHETW